MKHIAVVSQHKWGIKVHAADRPMPARPGTYRSLCGKPWQVAVGKGFEDIELADRCERCETAFRAVAA